jgi:hypothetical protein
MAGASNLKPFQKGKSGNPAGRPKIPAELREMARAASPQALQALIEVMADKAAPQSARVSAANSILDRGYGKPAQPIDGDGEGGAIKTSIEVRFIRPE